MMTLDREGPAMLNTEIVIDLDELHTVALEVSRQRKIIAVNKLAAEFGVKIGTHCWDTFGKRTSISCEAREYYERYNKVPEEGIKCIFCMADEALERQEHIITEVTIGEDIWETHWIPTGRDTFFHFGINITGNN